MRSSQSVRESSAEAEILRSLVWLTPPEAKMARSACLTQETYSDEDHMMMSDERVG